MSNPDLFRSMWRRAYAFLTVGLAVFLLTLTGIGVVCKGYATAANKNDSIRGRDHEQIASKLTMVKAELQIASATAAAAFKELETSKTALRDFIKTLSNMPAADRPQDKSSNSTKTNPDRSALEIENSPAAASPTTIANPRWTEVHDQLEKLQTRRAELHTLMMPSHPAILAIDSTIADVETLLETINKEIPGTTNSTIVQNQSTANAIARAVDPATIAPEPTIGNGLEDAPQREAELQNRKITERMETAANNYKYALFNQQQTAARKEKLEAEYFASISAPAEVHGSANPGTGIFIGFLAAIVLGTAAALGSRVSERTFAAASEVRQRLGLTVLGFISRRDCEPPRKGHSENRHGRRNPSLPRNSFSSWGCPLLLSLRCLINSFSIIC